MRPVCFALLLLAAAGAAAAASPEEAYIAARDAAVAKIKKMEGNASVESADKEQRKLIADLEKRLQGIIGGLSVKPFPAKGKFASDGLSENEVGSGLLDALRFSKGDNGPVAFVTTDGLFENWTNAVADWWKKTQKSPPTIDESLEADEFYTDAIGSDAAFSKTADVPIAKPEGATYAVALLGAWAQDIGPSEQQNLIVAIRRSGKIYIVDQISKKAKPIPACEAIWNAAVRKAANTPGNHITGAEDQRAFDASTAIQDKGDKDYRACYASHAPKEAFFAGVTAEAQEIADRFKGQ